jgi:hypothetical protein
MQVFFILISYGSNLPQVDFVDWKGGWIFINRVILYLLNMLKKKKTKSNNDKIIFLHFQNNEYTIFKRKFS